jgi:hypothetical protein
VITGLVLYSPVYLLQTDLARDPYSILFGFSLDRQVLCIISTMIIYLLWISLG